MGQKMWGFRMITICSLLLVEVMRLVWMPYTGVITLDWQFHLVRWVFYLITLGLANLFFVMSLTDFRFDFVRGIVLPMGIRIALDGLIFLSVQYLWLVSFSLRYILDILFLVLACILMTSRDRKRFERGNFPKSRPGRILLAAAAFLVLAMIVVLQADVLRIAGKYREGSASFDSSIRYHMVKAYVFSMAISILTQFTLSAFAVDKTQRIRLRAEGFSHYVVLLVVLGAALQARLFLYRMYIATGSFPQSFGILDSNKSWTDATVFNHEASRVILKREYFSDDGTFTEGKTNAVRLLNYNQDRSILFGIHDSMDSLELTMDGNEVHTYLPYALLFVDGQEQYMLKGCEIATMPENGMLTRILEQGILQNDYYFFEYGGEYLLKYDPEFITPYIERFSRGEFAEKGPNLTGDFRPEYIMDVARRLGLKRP